MIIVESRKPEQTTLRGRSDGCYLVQNQFGDYFLAEVRAREQRLISLTGGLFAPKDFNQRDYVIVPENESVTIRNGSEF